VYKARGSRYTVAMTDSRTRLFFYRVVAGVLVRHHLGNKWRVLWGRGTVYFGSCFCNQKMIILSKPLALAGKDSDFLDTVLHEIAHALAPDDDEHGAKWQAACKKVHVAPKATSGARGNALRRKLKRGKK
jgi:SprT-like family